MNSIAYAYFMSYIITEVYKYMKSIILKIKNNVGAFIIGTLGVILRFIAMLMANPKVFQHDVIQEGGHLDYAIYIFNHWKLADTNYYEFAQPPINAYLQAIVMKICSPFVRYSKINYTKLYSTTIVLTFIFSCLTLFIIYKILKEFDLGNLATNIAFAIMAFYPGIIVLSAQYSNDNISYMFFYLSLYLSIRWAKTKKLSTIILLALSIGIGMLTKISVGTIAFITGPMMLAVLIKSNDKKKIFMQLVIFALIVFPIGLSYSIRNYILFGQKLGGVWEIAKGTLLDMRYYTYTVFDRYLSLPINRLFDKKNGIYHDMYEYNIWVDMIKTSTFDEFNFGEGSIKTFLTFVYILNIVFYAVSMVCIVLTLIDVIKVVINKKMGSQNSPIQSDLHLNFKIMCLMLFALAIFSYVFFNVRDPYSCNSNYRYVAYITFAMSGCVASRFI